MGYVFTTRSTRNLVQPASTQAISSHTSPIGPHTAVSGRVENIKPLTPANRMFLKLILKRISK